MSRTSTTDRGTVYFCFANPTGFSGQKAAAELVMNGLAERGWSCRRLAQPMFDRGGGPWAALRYLLRVSANWARALSLLRARGAWLWVGLGQTRTAFLRDAVPLLLGRLGLGRSRVVVSLNGNVFMEWSTDSLEARLFRLLLRQAGIVTVVGDRQRARLLEWGFQTHRIAVIVNSCDLEPVPVESLATKHALEPAGARAVCCLHLSSLIDTKGFPEFLEALQHLAAQSGPPVEGILCGRVVASEFSSRFQSGAEAESWIESRCAEINRSPRVRVRWIKGAAGADKAALFHQADVFVLPTRYRVEAQPLVLLEAMAAGCAIVTTRAGEIPTILDKTSAVFLNTLESAALARVLQKLVSDPRSRRTLADAAHARFIAAYQPARHLDAWEALLTAAGTPRGNAA